MPDRPFPMRGRTYPAAPWVVRIAPTPRTAASTVDGADDTRRALKAIAATAPGTPMASKLNDPASKLSTALVEFGKKTSSGNVAGLGAVEGAAGELEAAVSARLLSAATGESHLQQLAASSRILAVAAINKAVARGGNATKIATARQALATADGYRASKRFKDAVAKYKDALSQANSA